MLNETIRALLGDQESQKKITAMGQLLPCQICLEKGEFQIASSSARGATRGWTFQITCKKCGYHTGLYDVEAQISKEGKIIYIKDERSAAVEERNTRPQILAPEQIERLEMME